jgi:hypothetical protein
MTRLAARSTNSPEPTVHTPDLAEAARLKEERRRVKEAKRQRREAKALAQCDLTNLSRTIESNRFAIGTAGLSPADAAWLDEQARQHAAGQAYVIQQAHILQQTPPSSASRLRARAILGRPRARARRGRDRKRPAHRRRGATTRGDPSDGDGEPARGRTDHGLAPGPAFAGEVASVSATIRREHVAAVDDTPVRDDIIIRRKRLGDAVAAKPFVDHIDKRLARLELEYGDEAWRRLQQELRWGGSEATAQRRLSRLRHEHAWVALATVEDALTDTPYTLRDLYPEVADLLDDQGEELLAA